MDVDELADVREQVEGRSAGAVELEDEECIELAAPSGAEDALEPGPVIPRAGAGLLDV